MTYLLGGLVLAVSGQAGVVVALALRGRRGNPAAEAGGLAEVLGRDVLGDGPPAGEAAGTGDITAK